MAGFIAQQFRANCTYSAGDVHLIRAVSAGDELFMRADRHREAAVLKRFRAPNPITDSSLQKVLVADGGWRLGELGSLLTLRYL